MKAYQPPRAAPLPEPLPLRPTTHAGDQELSSLASLNILSVVGLVLMIFGSVLHLVLIGFVALADSFASVSTLHPGAGILGLVQAPLLLPVGLAVSGMLGRKRWAANLSVAISSVLASLHMTTFALQVSMLLRPVTYGVDTLFFPMGLMGLFSTAVAMLCWAGRRRFLIAAAARERLLARKDAEATYHATSQAH